MVILMHPLPQENMLVPQPNLSLGHVDSILRLSILRYKTSIRKDQLWPLIIAYRPFELYVALLIVL